MLNKVKNKVNQRVDKKVDNAIDKGLDKAEGKEVAVAEKPVSTEENKPAEAPSVKSFSKYDFIPGEQIVYYENFEQDVIAELPIGWNTNGTGEVVTLDNIPGKWLRLHKSFNYLTRNEKELGENYTVEFDLVLQLKNNGWMYPEFSFGIFGTNGEPNTDNGFIKEFNKYSSLITTIFPGKGNSRMRIESFGDNKAYFKSEPKSLETLHKQFGKPIHIAIQVQKERCRLWINESKAVDVPKGIFTSYKMNQFVFKVGFTNYSDEQYGVYVSNLKVAQGVPDTRHKLIEEGKLSTTAILFDINSANLKPESYGVIKEIGDVLNQYKDVNIKIIGHTDSDGKDADNLSLSQKRAAAVKDALVNEYGIDASRIETDGKGESQPVADNKTKEGKAANRRVEFIKK